MPDQDYAEVDVQLLQVKQFRAEQHTWQACHQCKWPWTRLIRSWKLVHTSCWLSTHQNASWEMLDSNCNSHEYTLTLTEWLWTLTKLFHMLASYWARLSSRTDVWKGCSIQVKRRLSSISVIDVTASMPTWVMDVPLILHSSPIIGDLLRICL